CSRSGNTSPPLRAERYVIIHVALARAAGRGCPLLLRLDAEREKLRSLLAGLDPGRKPILDAFDVERSTVVAVVVFGLLVAFVEQRAAVCVVVVHFLVSLAQGDRFRWCAEAPGNFVDEALDALVADLRAHRRACSSLGD